MKWSPVLFFVFATTFNLCAQIETEASRMQAVEVSAIVQEAPPQITLVWPARNDANGYRIVKRNGQNWSEVAVLGGSANDWSDGNVAVGQRYEYKITKTTSRFPGWGYITAGIQAPLLEDTGKILILAQENVANSANGEIEQLRQDLILEGWEVIRQTVTSGASVPQVKDFIKSQWQADPSRLKAVLLLGHVPVPYSGNIFPDGHENHQGAWPADVYYAEMDANWTDSTVDSKVSERQVNWNVPGDGKFDQGELPSPVDLQLGRVDFFDMTCFANKNPSRSELDLTRQYLNKNHAFRSGQVQLQRRGMIIDNFGLRDTNGVSAVGWRNFSAFFGSANVQAMDLNTYFPRMRSESALWSWGAGGGSYLYSSGIGTSDDFALNDVNVAFTFWLGSYFGDWNNESNWMKAALGSGRILVSIYSGLPHSFVHGMALGETIGQGFLLSQNNNASDVYLPDGQGMGLVHQALLGDPTLRMFPRGGIGNLAASGGAGQVSLSWNRPGAGDLVGVHIYRGSSPAGPFTRVTASPIVGTSYSDAVSNGTYSYLARPVYLESAASGSFYNLGQGSIAANISADGGTPPPPPPPPGPITLSSRTGRGALILDIQASAGRGIIIEWSQDFKNWNQAGSMIIPDLGTLRFSQSITMETCRVYQVRYSGNP